MQHACSALIIHCMDFRLGKAVKEYLENSGLLNDCDIVAAAGAAKNLLPSAPEAERQFILKQIAISKNLHHIKKVILMNHTDCGAYGGRSAFTSREAEEETNRRDMNEAARLIRNEHPELEVETVLMNIKEDGSVNLI